MKLSREDEHLYEIARRLASATLSYQMGVDIGYAYKRYGKPMPNEEIGDAWIELARLASRITVSPPGADGED